MAHTRRIIAFNHVSADGFFADADGQLTWVIPEPQIESAATQGMNEIDTILFGRRTYQMFEAFWPRAAAQPVGAVDPHTGQPMSAAMHAMATFIDNATKIVFSRTLKQVTWKHAHVVSECTPAAVNALTRQPGKDIIMFGSGSIVSLMTQHGLVDEYQFVVIPTILGGGKSMITGLTTPHKLHLLEAKGYPSGTVMMRYGKA